MPKAYVLQAQWRCERCERHGRWQVVNCDGLLSQELYCAEHAEERAGELNRNALEPAEDAG